MNSHGAEAAFEKQTGAAISIAVMSLIWSELRCLVGRAGRKVVGNEITASAREATKRTDMKA